MKSFVFVIYSLYYTKACNENCRAHLQKLHRVGHIHGTYAYTREIPTILVEKPEMGTNNIISKAHRNKAQRSFHPVKAQRKLRNLFFLISEAQRNFRNELFDSVDAQRNSAIAERHFRTKLKRNLTSAIEISQHRTNTALFAIFDRKE